MTRSMSAAVSLVCLIGSMVLECCEGVVVGEKFIRNKEPSQLRFAMLSGGSEFFFPVKDGWEARCKELGVNCIYQAIDHEDSSFATGVDQCEYYLRKFMAIEVDGISSVGCLVSPDPPLYREITNAGIPLVTFDSDSPNSTRSAYIGTDNYFMGVSMARLLKQLRPEGGRYAVVTSGNSNLAERVAGFTDEITRDNDREDRAHWYEEPPHPDYWGMSNTARIVSFAINDPTAIVAFYQTPMRNEEWPEIIDAHRHRNITFIGTDGADYQLEYLSRRYVNGLVGQLPYDMGSESAQALYDMVTKGELEKEFIGTNLVAYNLIPLELPPVDVDQNLLEDWKYVGFILAGVVAFLALLCMAWTIFHWNDQVVLAAQPFFLMMLATGVLILVSALIPLSFDDKGSFEMMTTTKSTGICMSMPWLAFVGFTFIISCLFGKAWRVYKYYNSESAFFRLRLTELDVLIPFAILLTCNSIVLICWTVLDPLMYHREFDLGTDYWNREISSSGSCKSDHLAAYLVPLGIFNFLAVAVACWYAFQARDIESEFSEAKYIGFALLSVAQAFLTGIPIVAVVHKIPLTFYLVLCTMVFALCMALLLLIFWPKFFIRRAFAQLSEHEKKKSLSMAVRRSSVSRRHSSAQMTEVAGATSLGGSSGPCDYCGGGASSSGKRSSQNHGLSTSHRTPPAAPASPATTPQDDTSGSGSNTTKKSATGTNITPPSSTPSPPAVIRESEQSYQMSQQSEVTIDA